ncbi:MAG TPA: response regulator [Allosphingosinicella sp.]
MAIPLILILLGLLLAEQFRSGIRLRSEIERAHANRESVQTTFSLLQDVETGQRGYLLTGDPAFLAPYEQARAQLAGRIPHLAEHNGLQPEATRNLRETEELARRKLAFAERAVALQRSGRHDAAVALVGTGEGKALMDAMRVRIGRMQALEEAWVANAQQASIKSRVQLLWFTFSLLGVLVLFLTISAVAIARTLAARRQALEELEDISARQRAILDSASDAIITLNPSGTVETTNRAAETMFGDSADALVRRDIGRLFEVAPDRGGQENFLERLQSRRGGGQQGASEEFWAVRADGTHFPVDVSLSPMELADGTHFVAIIRDITERKQVEQMKSEFVSIVSHELRTPLTSIAGSLGLLSGGAAGTIPDKAARLIQIAHSNSERLVRLINDILDIEKIESGKMEFDLRPVLLLPLLRQAVQANSGFAESYGVFLHLEPGDEQARVMADADRLMQVVTNLLSNAVKFSPRGETVSISMAPLDRRHRITINDNGGGIPREFRNRIFGKFAQADSSDTRQKGGTGLGLSIVKEIVTRLRGSVSFDTVEGVGTAFHVDLPSAPPPVPSAVPDTMSRILICDGDPVSAQQIEEALGAAGYDSDVVASGEALNAALEERRYAAIILDLVLPGEDGIGLIRSLRSDPRHFHTPVIVVSAHAAADGGAVSQALPIVDWLQKPLPLDRLTTRVREALDRHANGQPRILHVDDDADVLNIVAAAFEQKAVVRSVPGLEAARAALAQERFDLVILDLGLADGSGLELLPDLKRADGNAIPVVIFSAQDADPKLARAVDAVLTKSRASLGRLVDTVEVLVAGAAGAARREGDE